MLHDNLEGNNVVEEVINNFLPPPVPEEQQLFQLADEMYVQQPLLPANHINMVVEEVPLDQLIDVDEFNLPEDVMAEDGNVQGQQEVGNMMTNS